MFNFFFFSLFICRLFCHLSKFAIALSHPFNYIHFTQNTNRQTYKLCVLKNRQLLAVFFLLRQVGYWIDQSLDIHCKWKREKTCTDNQLGQDLNTESPSTMSQEKFICPQETDKNCARTIPCDQNCVKNQHSELNHLLYKYGEEILGIISQEANIVNPAENLIQKKLNGQNVHV